MNCGAIGHPASYRGCPFAKTIQNGRLGRKNTINPKSGKVHFPELVKNPNIKISSGNTINSYSSAVKGGNADDSALTALLLSTITSQQEQIKSMSDQMGRLEATVQKLTQTLLSRNESYK